MTDFDASGDRESAPLYRLVQKLWIGAAIGGVGLAIAFFKSPDVRIPIGSIMAAIGVGTLIFLSAFSSGTLLGFLFGVPRVLSREQTVPTATAGVGTNSEEAGEATVSPAAALSDQMYGVSLFPRPSPFWAATCK